VTRLGGVVLVGDAVPRAEAVVRRLPQPFSVGDAARAMGTSRRVAVPLLERLDATLVTRRLPDGTRELRSPLRS
jgi:selenocysteine-specific elongation factor